MEHVGASLGMFCSLLLLLIGSVLVIVPVLELDWELKLELDLAMSAL
jgi:hypothetical protein